MWECIDRKASMLREGYAIGRTEIDAKGIAIAGMGGSAASGRLIVDAARDHCSIPITIVDHDRLPAYVKDGWHVLAVSYSGNTHETLAVAAQAKRRGIPMTMFTTGGSLAQLGEFVQQPSGMHPRVAVAHAWFSILGCLETSGIVPPVPVERAAQAVEQVTSAAKKEGSRARGLAAALTGHIPWIYSTPAFQGAATFFRCQLNENGKRIGATQTIPECNHNDIVAWGVDPARQGCIAICLTDGSHSERVAFMRERYQEWGVPWEEMKTGPTASFADHVMEQARMLQFADHVSMFVAEADSRNPSDIQLIIDLKARLG